MAFPTPRFIIRGRSKTIFLSFASGHFFVTSANLYKMRSLCNIETCVNSLVTLISKVYILYMVLM